ncbi:ABC transporter substrate-binding protein [Bacillus sp. FSL K6-3431]|uniref:ABC transporter substrate-binding protein n=1 Tax=Bacillus sp. FSL K6-3431 TaxID=2921500 RepID=UPI0030F69D84
MEKFKKFGFVSLILLFVFSIVLTGCSSSTGSKVEKVGDSDKTSITIWHPMTGVQGEGIEAVTKYFEDKNPDIKVNLVYTPGHSDENKKLTAAIAGGEAPDVVWFDRFKIAQFANQEAFTDLTDMADRDGVKKEDFYADAWDEASYKERLFGIPTTADTRMLFYNKDIFKKAGLDPDNPPKTIDELTEAADKLMIKEGDRFKQIGFVPWYGEADLMLWAINFGGEMFDKNAGKLTANNPEFVTTLQWMVDFGEKYGVENFTSFQDFEIGGPQEPFIAENLAMFPSGNWTVSSIEKYKPNLNYGVTPMPNITGENPKTMLGGWTWVIPKGAKHEEAAWEYIKFVTGPEASKMQIEVSNEFSSRPDVNIEVYSDDPIMKQFVESLDHAIARPVTTQGQLFRNGQRNAVDQAIHGNGSPKELLDKYTDEFNKALKRDQ